MELFVDCWMSMALLLLCSSCLLDFDIILDGDHKAMAWIGGSSCGSNKKRGMSRTRLVDDEAKGRLSNTESDESDHDVDIDELAGACLPQPFGFLEPPVRC